MADLIDDGPLWLSYGGDILKVSPAECFGDLSPKPKITRYTNLGGFSADFKEQRLVIKAKNIRFLSKVHAELFLATLFNETNGWQYNSGGFTLNLKDNAAMSTNTKFDGTYENYKVVVPEGGVGGIKKLGRGDDPARGIDMIVFEVITRS